MINQSKPFFYSCAATAIAYTGYVETKNRNRIASFEQFAVGAADDLIMDDLSSGDIILFSRRWYNYHIPKALMIKAYQILNKSDFDHAGIVVLDCTGNAQILELCSKGYSLSPYYQRIQSARANQIAIIPLEPRNIHSEKDARYLNDFAQSLVNQKSQPNEVMEMLKGSFTLVASLFGFSLNIPVCPSIGLIRNALLHVRVSLCKRISSNNVSGFNSNSDISITCNDLIIQSNILLKGSMNERLGPIVIVRTK